MSAAINQASHQTSPHAAWLIAPRPVYAALLALAALWLVLIVAPPLLAHAHRELAAFVLYRSFAAVCHQIPARSYRLCGFPLAVCARCTGIYAGAFVGLCVYPLVRRLSSNELPPRRWLLLAVLPTAVDFVGGTCGLFTNTHPSRLLTGAVAGCAAAFYIMPMLMGMSAGLIWPHILRRPAKNASHAKEESVRIKS